MIPSIRRYFFVIFAVFFIVISPIISIFSLGYDIDLKNQTLDNKLTISIDTLPRRVLVTSGNTQLNGYNTFKSEVNTLIPLSIQRDGYYSENFYFWSEKGVNSFATIKDLTLWPNEANIFVTDDTIITILSKNRLLLKKETGEVYIQIYDVRGLRDEREVVTTDSRIKEIPSEGWREVGENTFWNVNDNLLLQEARQNQWQITALSNYIDSPIAIAPINNDRVLVLSQNGVLWLWDRSTTQKVFVDSQIEGLFLMDNPATVWILDDNSLFRFNSNTFASNIDTIVFDNFKHSSTQNIVTKTAVLPYDMFSIEPLYQGFAIRVGSVLYYSYDFNVDDWIVLTRNAKSSSVYGHTAFWMDVDGSLWVHNLQLNITTRLGNLSTLPTEHVSLFYNFTQQRLMIYTPKSLYTSWIAVNETNQPIAQYPLYKITDLPCYPKMEKSQFCYTTNTLQSYQNTRLF